MQRTKTGDFNWVDLSAKNFEAQSAFYEALLDWTHNDMPYGEGQVYRMFYRDGSVVAAISQLPAEMIAAGVPSMWNTYVATDDVDATVAKAVELGGEIAMPPSDVPMAGRMAAIKDPTGGVLFVWKPMEGASTSSMIYLQPGAYSWVDLNARDVDAASAFYAALLGWKMEPLAGEEMPYWQISVDGQGEGGMMPMPDMVPAEAPSFWMPYFGSADLGADVAKAEQLGASVLVAPQEAASMVSFAILADPGGATFALMQPSGTMHW